MRRRNAFTLVELLVAMALIVLIMAVTSQAFVEGIDAFRHLKAIGDMQEDLRTAAAPLRRDLLLRHFGNDDKLSDLPLSGAGVQARPTEGFFRIQAPSETLEGVDGEGIPSHRATNHILHFTMRTTGKRRDDWLHGRLWESPSPLELNGPSEYNQAGLMLSQWEEVAWFLAPQPNSAFTAQETTPSGGTPLWTLHRRKRLLTTNANVYQQMNVTAPVPATDAYKYAETSVVPRPPVLQFNNPRDTTSPLTRGMMDPTGSFSQPVRIGTGVGEGALAGVSYDDHMTPNIVSFEVQVLFDGSAEFVHLSSVGGVYDTATTTPLNLLKIRALKITIRVWDARTEQTRQISVIQDM
jgi:prepilin-type N-terminal cleavage/methylation domain-containing protein